MGKERLLVVLILFFVFVVVLGIIFAVVGASAEPASAEERCAAKIVEMFDLLYVGAMDINENRVPDIVAIQVGKDGIFAALIVYDYYGGAYLGRVEVRGGKLLFFRKGEKEPTEIGPGTGRKIVDVLPEYAR